jgi:hypothetical protein
LCDVAFQSLRDLRETVRPKGNAPRTITAIAMLAGNNQNGRPDVNVRLKTVAALPEFDRFDNEQGMRQEASVIKSPRHRMAASPTPSIHKTIPPIDGLHDITCSCCQERHWESSARRRNGEKH